MHGESIYPLSSQFYETTVYPIQGATNGESGRNGLASVDVSKGYVAVALYSLSLTIRLIGMT